MAKKPRCAVEGCNREATVEVILYDVYPFECDVFFERDFTCPHLCAEHMAENETRARGVRTPRGHVEYPFTNKHSAQGFTIYRPLDAHPRRVPAPGRIRGNGRLGPPPRI